MGQQSLRVKSSATNLSFSGEPEAGTTVFVAKKDAETRPTDEGIRAKAAREALGWSQDDLAKRATAAVGKDVSRTHFGNFETGANKGGGADFLRYMRLAFGVSAETLEAMLSGAISTDAFVKLVREAPPTRGGPGPGPRTIAYDDDYPNRGEAVAIIEQALGDMRRVANAEGDRSLDWWLDTFGKLVRVRADGAARVDAIVSSGEDPFDAKPSLGPGVRRGK